MIEDILGVLFWTLVGLVIYTAGAVIGFGCLQGDAPEADHSQAAGCCVFAWPLVILFYIILGIARRLCYWFAMTKWLSWIATCLESICEGLHFIGVCIGKWSTKDLDKKKMRTDRRPK